jgi:hypothetical protein
VFLGRCRGFAEIVKGLTTAAVVYAWCKSASSQANGIGGGGRGSYLRVSLGLAETNDGVWIRVRHLEVPDDPTLAGTEDLISEGEVEALLGVARTGGWDEKVTVILHHIPESEESEEGYEVVTMKGVPYTVSITGSDGDFAGGALNHLLDGLRAFGFAGRVAVEDVMGLGPANRYEVYEVSVSQP